MIQTTTEKQGEPAAAHADGVSALDQGLETRKPRQLWRRALVPACVVGFLLVLLSVGVWFTEHLRTVPFVFEYAEAAYRKSDYATAFWLFRPLAEQGDNVAQHRLGFLYANGHGVPKDDGEAVRWWRKAADQGNADAQSWLGWMYLRGRGVQPNNVLAHMWSDLSAAQGDQSAFNSRKEAASRMTPEQIAEAQRLAREWKPRSPQFVRQDDRLAPSTHTKVRLKPDRGTFVVPVEINGALTLDFIIDSGAADVSVPADVFSTLRRTGTIKDSDITGKQTYVLADGSETQSSTFTIRSLKVGGKVIENVRGSVASPQGSLLLGQSFLGYFKSWSIDNTTHELLLDPR